MTVDVFYEGYALGRGLSAKRDGERLFVELTPPMPVGTALMLVVDGQEQALRVASVSEGVPPGVWLSARPPESSAPQKPVEGETTAPERAKKDRRSRSRRDVHGK